jgi:hypothetical protein
VLCSGSDTCKFKRCDGEQLACPDGSIACGRECNP